MPWTLSSPADRSSSSPRRARSTPTEIYRREVTVTGSRSATRRHMEDAVALLPQLDLPDPLVLPLERFDEGVAAYRNRQALKVVFRP